MVTSIDRALCGGNKRSDPPNDGNTPLAATKKRRAVNSDGNMPTVPNKLWETAGITSVNRLQRCRSMVEQSVSFQLNKCKLPLLQIKNLYFFLLASASTGGYGLIQEFLLKFVDTPLQLSLYGLRSLFRGLIRYKDFLHIM